MCRQLGFPHGTWVDSTTNPAFPDRVLVDNGDFQYLAPATPVADEGAADDARQNFWISSDQLLCRGTEERLVDCDLGFGFFPDDGAISACRTFRRLPSVRQAVACRMFPVVAALEKVTTPGAGAHPP